MRVDMHSRHQRPRKRNEKDPPEITDEVKNTPKFHFVENVDQVLQPALGTAGKNAAGKGGMKTKSK